MKKNYKNSSHAIPGERKARMFQTGYEATIRCMKCGKAFESLDRRKVRHCDVCRKQNGYIADSVGIGGEHGP